MSSLTGQNRVECRGEEVSLAYRLRLNQRGCIFTFSQEMCVQFEISFFALRKNLIYCRLESIANGVVWRGVFLSEMD